MKKYLTLELAFVLCLVLTVAAVLFIVIRIIPHQVKSMCNCGTICKTGHECGLTYCIQEHRGK